MTTALAWPSIEEQIAALPSGTLYKIVDGEVQEIEHMGMLIFRRRRQRRLGGASDFAHHP